MHIHYTQGPPILADISKEESDAIIALIEKNVNCESIQEQFNCSAEVVEALKDIHDKKLRRCCFCGALFDPKGHSRRCVCYQPEHYLPCIDCGRPVKVVESYAAYMKAGGRRCFACRNLQIGHARNSKSQAEKDAIIAKQQATMLRKYGADSPLKVPELKAKVQATIKERYGVDNLSQSDLIQARIQQNSQEKYGVDHYSNAPEIRARMIEGMIAKYGASNPQQCLEIQEKTKQTNLAKYGVENVMQSEVAKQHFVENHRAKYGVDWPHQRPDLIEQVRQSNMEKYNAPMYPVSDEYLRTLITDPLKFEAYKEFSQDPVKFIKTHFDTKPTYRQVSQVVGVCDSTIGAKLTEINRHDLIQMCTPVMESQLIDAIHSIDSTIQIESHNRTILEGKEIDVLLPDYNIGFECNPAYTHNSSFKDPWGQPPKHYKYHANKSILAATNGVFLYHIFGYEWELKQQIILSQIRNLLGKNTRKIYGRNTDVVEVSHEEAKVFLDHNHRQGFAQSKIRLGLVDRRTHELVSLMTFGKMRPGIGKKSTQTDTEWELIRYCNCLDTTVIGSASKLLNHFIKRYSPTKIVSFSDVAHTRGKIYETLGFKFISLSEPGYVWVDPKTEQYFTRVKCQKSNLPHLFNDVTPEDLLNHTESDIMMSHGYSQVFDSGVIRWELEVSTD